jgi:hypothetical protein
MMSTELYDEMLGDRNIILHRRLELAYLFASPGKYRTARRALINVREGLAQPSTPRCICESMAHAGDLGRQFI